jgi:hypothetical protein
MAEAEKYASSVDHVLQLARKEALARAGFFGTVSRLSWRVSANAVIVRDFYL